MQRQERAENSRLMKTKNRTKPAVEPAYRQIAVAALYKAVADLYKAAAALYNERDRPERDGLILCFGSQETAMLCNQLLLGSLSSFSLLVPYVCIIHNRSTDEDGSVSTEADTKYQGYGKTTDRLTAEDCDSKHCHESRY